MLLLNNNAGIPLYQQIYEQFRDQILSGALPVGSRLPAIRTLARTYHVSIVTVSNAYNQLQTEGYVSSVAGSGYYVQKSHRLQSTEQPQEDDLKPSIDREHMASRLPDCLYDFQYGKLDRNIYQTKGFRRALSNALIQLESAHGTPRPDPQGEYRLRKAITDHLRVTRGVNAQPSQVVIVGSLHETLKVLWELLPHDHYALGIEDPCFPGSRNAFEAIGQPLSYIPVDSNGITIGPLQGKRDMLLYTMSSRQFPTGCIQSESRKLELLQWAEESNSYIIEDDYCSTMLYEESPARTLFSMDKGKRVFYLGSFSYTVSPDMRLSFFILPPGLDFNLAHIYPSFGIGSPVLTQLILAEYISSGDYMRLINKDSFRYQRKHDRIIEFLHQRFPNDITIHGIGSGIHFLLELNVTLSEHELVEAFARRGIRVSPSSLCWHNPAQCRPSQILFHYGSIPEEALSEYLEAFAVAFQDILQSHRKSRIESVD